MIGNKEKNEIRGPTKMKHRSTILRKLFGIWGEILEKKVDGSEKNRKQGGVASQKETEARERVW